MACVCVLEPGQTWGAVGVQGVRARGAHTEESARLPQISRFLLTPASAQCDGQSEFIVVDKLKLS